MNGPEDLVDALLGPQPLAALDALDLTDPSLRQVREAARQRLAAARELLSKGLATSERFGRTDCWSRTAAGAAAVRAASG